MAKIVSIETATKVCSVALHLDGKLIAAQTYHLEKSHSSLLPVIIKEMLLNCDMELSEVDAFAVSSGPGSYTGLRIGVTTAKGLCYSLEKKLIGIPTLASMELKGRKLFGSAYVCPMIDARRMEVYCRITKDQTEIWSDTALIVTEDVFSEFVDEPVYLYGDGAAKTKEVLKQKNIRWIGHLHPSAIEIGELAELRYQAGDFEDVAYFEPFYLKDFQTKPAKKLL